VASIRKSDYNHTGAEAALRFRRFAHPAGARLRHPHATTGARIVTFANGMVVRELIVDIDDEAKRLVWSAISDRLTHHNASAQVFSTGDGQARVLWIPDVLPDEAAGPVGLMMEQGWSQ